MALEVSILYRGPLASCNYRCGYCPFGKRTDSTGVLAEDRQALDRFIGWVAGAPCRISVFFTPWGEALIQPWYRDAMCMLSRMANVDRVAAQTNLACPIDWLRCCNLEKIGLWCTYHPSQVQQDHFLGRCAELDELNVRYSVGSVGIIEEMPQIEQLRGQLSPDAYLWVNAYKHVPDYYSAEHIRRLGHIDPLFRLSTRRYRSAGRLCRTGHSVISVYGDGTIQRCHFVRGPLGNVFESDLSSILRRRVCSAETCDCHIGYVHLDDLGLDEVYGAGLLERIPAKPIWRDPLAREEARRRVQSTLLGEDEHDEASLITPG